MYQPFWQNGRLIWGIEGVGNYGFIKKQRNDGKLILTTTINHYNDAVREEIQKLKPDKVILEHGAGFKILKIIEGTADIYLYPFKGTKKWDTCAPEAVLRSAGGQLTDIRGNKLIYDENSSIENSEGTLCSLHDHDKYVKLLSKN